VEEALLAFVKTGDFFNLDALFLMSFLAATILPLGCEPILISMALSDRYDFLTLGLVATLGNSLGSFTCYGLGFLGKYGWLRIPEQKVYQWKNKIKKWGPFMGLWAWLPLIGDPLVIGLGLFRVPWKRTFAFIVIGKAIRFSTILWIFRT
jgi:membrane protein YqaA with SNARE-associated domain